MAISATLRGNLSRNVRQNSPGDSGRGRAADWGACAARRGPHGSRRGVAAGPPRPAGGTRPRSSARRRSSRTEDFLWSYGLEANWGPSARSSTRCSSTASALPNFQDISTDQATITDDDRWKTFFLYGFGFRSDTNCALCPETARLVESVPGMKTAMFSILAPHKHIPDHCGPYKGVVRYHLALKVPEPREQCRIRVGDEIVTWEEGRSLLFDDTYEHEVWNDTDDERVVLFLDVVRPLRFPMNIVNWVVITAIAWSPVRRPTRSAGTSRGRSASRATRRGWTARVSRAAHRGGASRSSCGG